MVQCICGLAAAVTDLLQSVQLEYHGYQGDTKETGTNNGATSDKVKEHLNGLFSLVQGLGGTAVVRTYIDQLAQVLSALVGWSKIDKCWDSKGNCKVGGNGYQHGIKTDCEYLKDVKENTPCKDCGCMKWEVTRPDDEGTPLGRKCTRCSSGGSSSAQCSCSSGGGTCSAGKDCKCAKEGKCCKCCCNSGSCKDKCQKDAKCSCDKEDRYRSAYPKTTRDWADGGFTLTWVQLVDTWMETKSDSRSASLRRHHCARILLGSVCLIWSGLTYMYWTGKWAKGSPRWNNHILDGSGLDDGTLSQWLQALGFPRDMINNSGPRNRWDAVIWDGFRGMLYLGFPDTGNGSPVHGGDYNDNTFRQPAGMNYAGYIHTVDRGAFCSKATVFKKDNGNGATSITDEQMHKCGALYKLYILSCAYFTGLQKKRSTQSNTPTTPRTIREIIYWLSALPYSEAYPKILQHSKEILKKVAPEKDGTKTLSFLQTGRTHPITVHEFNLFAHFQAVTQYCPLVLIGIQGGIHSTKGTDSTKEPPIHSLYANTECRFTYPTVSIQAYNQVVHYIRALFYQLYFLRKQCAVKVAMGGKWRECRYGDGVVSKGVISWMCLGCNPMEHDRKCRVEGLKKGLDGVINKLKALEGEAENTGGINGVKELREGIEKLRDILGAIGDVVVQLGNAQERLDTGKNDLDGVKEALKKVEGVNGGNGFKDVLKEVLEEVKKKVTGLGKAGGLKDAKEKAKNALEEAKAVVDKQNGADVDPCKNLVSAAIDGLHKALEILKGGLEEHIKEKKGQLLKAKKNLSHVFAVGVSVDEENALLDAINQLISICTSPKCSACESHSTKCGKPPTPSFCQTCLQPTTTGVPSPLQAFLEDRLPGFSCDVVRNTDTDKDTVYPPAASHLGHCGLIEALGGVVDAGKYVLEKNKSMLSGKLKGALEKVIEVVLEVVKKLEEGVKKKNGKGLENAKAALDAAQKALKKAKVNLGNGNGKELGTAKENLESLSKDGKGLLQEIWKALGELDPNGKEQSLKDFIDVSEGKLQVDPGKNTVSEFIHKSDTEVIGTLIDQLAQGLQKWVGWKDTGDDCCLKGEGGKSTGIGRECKCTGSSGGSNCCGKSGPSTTCHECGKCGTSAPGQKCYLSAYCKNSTASSGSSSPTDLFLWTSISSDSEKVHLLARIFLGSVCLIWSGLSQLGFLTGGSGGKGRWSQDGTLSKETDGLGSFMAAMGYDLDRLNGSGPGEYCLG
ncbi:variant erythrocyte surface antigen-1 alpha subunit [Babesia bovis T2Bo]|uniref:Variant erythrocyte surface antigen-1, alpha subunit n=1 Tax=Babesia bovis TaxID=5865 RepID=A7AML9_BABBO|nr:variant erythrocyte surface antigen-1 alpha subunit [Babesia bovis T2Bo]EDO07803.1 variant erythrocyte surface antigen-1 alpha subunit [Babesia bovis T2Bo]|eukprot:XP_001611371.1 variant erythrocyte surface antigen-1, alpha subunit [Babesia bovis T2Bo]